MAPWVSFRARLAEIESSLHIPTLRTHPLDSYPSCTGCFTGDDWLEWLMRSKPTSAGVFPGTLATTVSLS